MSELTAFNAYCKSNGINANGQLATEDLAPAFSAGYKVRQDTLRQRVAKLEKELNEVRKAEREKCAALCEKSDRYRGDYFAAKIRVMGDE